MRWSTVLTGISTLVLFALMTIYARSYRAMRSKYTLGLLLFVGLFVVQNIISLYFYFTMMDFYVAQVLLHVFLFNLLEAIALIVLLLITWG